MKQLHLFPESRRVADLSASELHVGQRVVVIEPEPGLPSKVYGTITGIFGSRITVQWDCSSYDFSTTTPIFIGGFSLTYLA